MDSEELDSQRRQERLRRRRQRERDARARETAEQREARLARRRERYRAQRRQESQHTRQAQMDANRAAQRLRREAETTEARQLPSPSYCQSKPSFVFSMLSSVLRVFTPSAHGIQLSAHALLSLSQAYIRTYKFLHALRGCSRSLPRCAIGNGLQTTSLAACSGSPHNARIH